ncbi:hypothetical protein [Bizionia sp.]|uniref:hypothetical protein n=1 Tax=Bizionia sp. TaxID=1954480 RepID=UPI003A8E2311
MKIELSQELKNSIQNEIENNSKSRKAIFKAMTKEVFPNVKSTALLVGENVDLFGYE